MTVNDCVLTVNDCEKLLCIDCDCVLTVNDCVLTVNDCVNDCVK